MRVALALAATVSAQLDWSDDLREIHAIGIQNQWLVEKLAPSALFGRHERRLRRQADDCQDNHPRCDEYAEYCDNVQFATTCAASCNTCDTSSSEPEPASSDASGCEDQLGYCEQMKGFCGNPNYEGVRLYCRKTCDSCGEAIEVGTDGASADADSGVQTCEDKDFCVNFPYCPDSEILRERIKASCPVTCKVAACQAYWTTDATEAPFKEAPPADACVDASMACSGVTELCQKDDFRDTLETYCKQTCGFCSADADAAGDGDEASGACENKYPNCDQLQFMCEEEQYKGPFIKMCPITCGVCEGDGSAPAATSEPAGPTKCEDTAEHCGSLSSYCDKPETKDMMAQQCALTCGFCQAEGSENDPAAGATEAPAQEQTPEDACVDTPGTDCQKYLLYCDNTNTQIPKVCKKSCGHCGADAPAKQATTTQKSATTTTAAPTTTKAPTTKASSTIATTMADSECAPVKDKSTKCSSYKKFCQNPKYKAKLASQCPATCNVCVKSKPEAKAPASTGAVCKDNVPAQCPKMKRYCGSAKYEKVLRQKCSLTCGFCTVDGSAPTQAPAASEKFGKWSVSWSKCNSKCKQYKARKCLQAPCPKTQLYQFRDCPAEENQNIPACSSSGAAKPAAKTCSNRAGANFCTVCRDKSPQCKKYASKCGNAQILKTCPATCGKCGEGERKRRRRRSIFDILKPKKTSETCFDKIACQQFVRQGFCKSSSALILRTMQSSCAKACGFCKPKPACIWNSWMSWTSCSRSCGTGAQTRSRKMIGSDCIGSPIETRQCNMQSCPTPPPTTTKPAPTPNNKYQGECKDEETWCSGIAQSQCRSSIQVAARCRQSCGLCIAAISAPTVGGGKWQPWTAWTACSGSCKGGFKKTRERRCGEYGRKCDGSSSETIPCSIGFDCYVDEFFKCADKSDNCNEYALEGRCFDNQYRDWMNNNCEASCRLCMGLNIQWSEWSKCEVPGGVCGNGKRKRSHDTTTMVENCNIPCKDKSTSSKADCKDKHPYCPNLTTHCESKSVQSACQFTCNSCPADIPVDNTCVDKNSYVCSQSANCKKEEFQYLCPKTCNTCMKAAKESVDNSSLDADSTRSNCKDLSPACKGAGIKAQCTNNLWLKKNCRETCGTCGMSEEAMTTKAPMTTMSPICMDKSRECPRWKSMCQTQREILETKCPVTCGVCVPETTKAPLTTTTTTKVATSPKTINCLDGPLCSHYAGNWEINCRDSQDFRDTCPTLCKIDVCAEYWDEDLIPENTDELEKRWRAWEEWGACSVSCGGGERTRYRTCKAPVYKPCTYGSDSDTGLCNKISCTTTQAVMTTPKPTVCEDQPFCDGMGVNFCSDPNIASGCPKMCDNCQPYYGEWGEWSTCTATCRGSGSRTRSRECIQVNEDKPGKCEGDASETDDCPDIEICFDEWTKWTECDADCGNNSTQTRQRVCNEPEDCEWVEKESQECAGACVFNEWSEWSDCSATCGNATATRSRDCPVEGACGEESSETMDCELDDCAEYLDWSEWSECSVSCGGGEMRRERECSIEGECASLGAPSGVMACNEDACPVVAEWGEWSSYSPCSESCGVSFKTRSHECVNGAIGSDGCPLDDYVEVSACLYTPCETWSEWSACSAECGQGHRERSRGEDVETINCYAGLCSDVGEWTEWEIRENNCEITCGGYKLRERQCINGIPSEGGCQGPSSETIECEPCGEWNVWTSWSECNKSCHTDGVKGIRSRSRKCMGGRCKAGDAEEIISCVTPACDFKPTLRTTTEWETTSTSTQTTFQITTTDAVPVTTTTTTVESTATAENTDTTVLEAELDRLFDSITFGQPDCDVVELSEEPTRFISSSFRQTEEGKQSFHATEALSTGWCAEASDSDQWLVIDYASDVDIVGVKFNIVNENLTNPFDSETQSMRYMTKSVKIEYNQDGQWTPVQSVDSDIISVFSDQHMADPFGKPSVERFWTKKITTDRIRISIVSVYGRTACLNFRVLTCHEAPAIEANFGLPPFAMGANPFAGPLSENSFSAPSFATEDSDNVLSDLGSIELDGSGDEF